MAEWFKAAVLKTASLKGDVGSATLPRAGEAEGAKRLSTSYSFVADEKRLAGAKFCEKVDCNWGGMAEWFKAAVLKTASPKGDVGSNPTPSATNHVGFVACPKPHMV